MKDDLIENNPSFKKLKQELREIKLVKNILPLMRLFGMDTKKIEEAYEKIPQLEKELETLRQLPDKFNKIFSDQGWIFSDIISIEVAKKAISIYESNSYKSAEKFLVDYYSPDWVEKHLIYLKFSPAFSERYFLAEKALDDYKEGRYYSSILVTLTLIDGWVNELNIVEFQRKGFFDKDSELVAWDSITAHAKGLVKLQEVFSKSRNKTRVEEITTPYRHGILHGMDLGYDNIIVAAKCWAALFAVRDWVIKAGKGELQEPIKVEEEEKTLKQTISDLQSTLADTKKLENWQPRTIEVGKDLPAFGQPEKFSDNTPEKILIEFLEYWIDDNYGYMAKCYAPMFDKKPIDIRKEYEGKLLISYKLIGIIDKAPGVTDIKVKVKIKVDGEVKEMIFEFRLIINFSNGDFAYIPNDKTIWGISNRKTINE